MSKEVEERYVTLVQRSKMKCRYAEGSLEFIDGSGSEDDLYETEHVEKLVSSALEHASEIDDEFYRSAALHPVAELLTKAGQFDRAIQDYNRSIQIKPDLAEAYCNRGLAYAEKGQPDRAIQDCDKAIELNPKISRANIARFMIDNLQNRELYQKALWMME